MRLRRADRRRQHSKLGHALAAPRLRGQRGQALLLRHKRRGGLSLPGGVCA
jgi:hypothetical protein